ncbi:MAG TPA: hypothetical protein VIK05_09665 [Ilumatobacteraceae bacterium]
MECCWGYFFGPKRTAIPTLSEVAQLCAEGAILIERFGHLDLEPGSWTVIGQLDSWDRTAWGTV